MKLFRGGQRQSPWRARSWWGKPSYLKRIIALAGGENFLSRSVASLNPGGFALEEVRPRGIYVIATWADMAILSREGGHISPRRWLGVVPRLSSVAAVNQKSRVQAAFRNLVRWCRGRDWSTPRDGSFVPDIAPGAKCRSAAPETGDLRMGLCREREVLRFPAGTGLITHRGPHGAGKSHACWGCLGGACDRPVRDPACSPDKGSSCQWPKRGFCATRGVSSGQTRPAEFPFQRRRNWF